MEADAPKKPKLEKLTKESDNSLADGGSVNKLPEEGVNDELKKKEETSGDNSKEPKGEETRMKTEESKPEVTEKSGSVPRAGSPEKKVILLNPVLSTMFKSPPAKQQAGKMSEGGKTDGQNGGLDLKTEQTSANLQNSEILKASLALAAALKSEPKKKVFCANTNCNMKTDVLFEATSYAKLYFGMKTASSPKICASCFNKAEQYHKSSKLKLRNRENLFDLKCEIQTASSEAVVDLDSPVASPQGQDTESFTFGDLDAQCSQGEVYQISADKFDMILSETMRKFDYKLQLGKCSESVTKEVENLAYQFANLDTKLDELRSSIENTTKLYNENVACKPKNVEIGAVHIDARGGIRVQQNENTAALDGMSRIGEKQFKKAIEDLKTIEVKAAKVETPSTQLVRNQAPYPPPGVRPPNLPQNRRMGKLIFVKPKEGQDVYAMHKHALCYWLPAKILQISHSNSPNRPTIYRVQFQQKVKPRAKTNDDLDAYIKEVTGKQLAFKKPSSVTLPVGTRIIAKFKDLLNTDQEVDGCLYAGVISELPREVNKMRYLVFFDDGYAQYVHPNEVFPVVESSTDVWADVHKNSQEFIRDYLLAFPNRHMIRAEIGASFTVELNGQWLLARIVEVDSSLLKMQYLRRTDGVEFEWIYRGSTRLGPLYTRLKTLQQRPVNTVARRHTYSSRRTNFSFEVNRDDVEEENNSKVARKHTGFDGQQGKPPGAMIKTKNGMIISTVLESEGSMVKIQIPRECPVPREYTPHACSIKCGHKYSEDKFRRVSPLAIPFYLGWAREMAGSNRNKVFYHTPCGIRLGTYNEIHTYITRTGSEIPIDFFSLEANIDCLNEFEPLRRIEYLKDISYGKEWTPVTCINSLDHDLPAYMEYITARIPGKGVNISNDDDFLVCCDCEDDCQDKDKCACWQMTLSGVSFKIAAKEGTQLEGYENRRLKNHVLSGIYECNRKCKCRSTCFNRVVQNKVKWPIQMFKTVAKGWGVRALHDMPQGSFICVYTGQLLTDAGANESGISAGDEYLAELDFIECNEQIKEDYESDCTDIEQEEPGTRSAARLAATEQKKEQVVAKKSTINKAVKSTGGTKRKQDDDVSGYYSDTSVTTVGSSSTSRSSGQATARKSGSKNGSDKGQSGNGGGGSPSSSGVPSPASSGVGSSGRPKRQAAMSRGKDDSGGDSDEGDDIQAYSSFSASASAGSKKNAPRLPLREYFGKDEAVYIMDAKSMGNFGRYLNHSCDPNVFVQNLFVDTHDPRFPWVAFFTKKDVKAGTELTWDYNYDIGSVPGKTLYCFCLQGNCRGRLL